MDVGKAIDIYDLQTNNSLTLNTDYLGQFFHRKNKSHFRDISTTGWGYEDKGCICRIGGVVSEAGEAEMVDHVAQNQETKTTQELLTESTIPRNAHS